MKLIICGGRDYVLDDEDRHELDLLLDEHNITEVVSGGCQGADQGGEEWATDRRIHLTIIRANWRTHGKAAGPIRNQQMAEYADAVYAFPGGRGTANMLHLAQKEGLKILS